MNCSRRTPGIFLQFIVVAAFVFSPASPCLQGAFAQARPPLASSDLSDIATLLRLEDSRTFDSTALATMLASRHPEVRRRAALAVGRIVDPRGAALLRSARGEADTAVAASVAFATGQLADSSAVGWLNSLLTAPGTPVTVAVEAANALGKIRTAETRAMLVSYLSSVTENARTAPVIGEALLSVGRFTIGGDISAVVKWAAASDPEVRWRAAWALFRPRDPAAVPHLMRLTEDSDARVRNWAVHGLVASTTDSSQVAAAQVVGRLVQLLSDADRSVRTEAMRALGTFQERAAWDAMASGLSSPDAWIAVSAAEGLGRMRSFGERSVGPLASAATDAGRSTWVRSVAFSTLVALSADSAMRPVGVLSRDSAVTLRVAAVNFLRGRGAASRALLEELSRDAAPSVSGPAAAALAALDDTTAAAGRAGRGGGGGARGGGGRGGGGGGGGRGGRAAIETGRTDADYLAMVTRWVVPEYNGAPRPRAEWTTPRGTITLELFAADAPIAMTDFVSNVESGRMVGTAFTRVVPDFVDQQQGIPGHAVVRDEVNRHRLTRANLAWASAGLDTGRPGYTLGNMPMPHNEGGFTSLGRVVAGLDVMDRIELGDAILATRMLPVR